MTQESKPRYTVRANRGGSMGPNYHILDNEKVIGYFYADDTSDVIEEFIETLEKLQQ